MSSVLEDVQGLDPVLSVQDVEGAVEVGELAVVDVEVFGVGGEDEGRDDPVRGVAVVLNEGLAMPFVQGALGVGLLAVVLVGSP